MNDRKLNPILDKYVDAPGSLITILQKTQDEYGYLPEDALAYIADRTGIALSKIYGVATFYTQFRLKPIGKYLLMLCMGTACHVNGAAEITEAVSERLGIASGETTRDGLFTMNIVACLGCCSLAPVMMVRSQGGEEVYGNLTMDSVVKIIDGLAAGDTAIGQLVRPAPAKDGGLAAAQDEHKARPAPAKGAALAAAQDEHKAGGKLRIAVGEGSCGVASGARKTEAALREALRKAGGEAAATVEITGCIGNCYLEPIVDVYEEDGRLAARYVKVSDDKAAEIVERHVKKGEICENLLIGDDDANFLGLQVRIVLKNVGVINPEKIEEYVQAEGYEALKKALFGTSPVEIIEELKIAGLRGRGGAGFPTWFKWNAARGAGERYMVCNADEGDPGAFMDRSVLEGDPHSVIEGMIIGGYAIGASAGIIYVRAEYPLAIRRLTIAIEQAEKAGFLGKNILGSGFGFSLRIKAGAGAFVCGEETALIASLEGERGMPRLKPPFPAQRGLWKQPTNINNVETFANVPFIIRQGGKAFAALGTDKSAGTKVFALAGKIRKGGLVEVPMGLPLKRIIFGLGGGVKNDREFKAVQLGGPSGGCIPAALANTPVDYENITRTGAIVGSGGMVVMDEDTCMVDMARYFIDFTRKESCGKCNYCRVGTKRMLEILERITLGQGEDGDIEKLEELAGKIKDGAMCGLGQTAPNPVLTTIKYFRNEYEDHIYRKRCTAHYCKALISFSITEACTGCTGCVRVCPAGAISGKPRERHFIDEEVCVRCGRCEDACRFGAIIRDLFIRDSNGLTI